MKQLIIVRKDLIKEYGYPKMMVQVAHVSTKLITDKISKSDNGFQLNISNDVYNWSQNMYKKIVVYVKSEQKLLNIFEDIKTQHDSVLIQDMALTVFPKPTYTCVGIIGTDEDMNSISKKYKLQLLK